MNAEEQPASSLMDVDQSDGGSNARSASTLSADRFSYTRRTDANPGAIHSA